MLLGRPAGGVRIDGDRHYCNLEKFSLWENEHLSLPNHGWMKWLCHLFSYCGWSM